MTNDDTKIERPAYIMPGANIIAHKGQTPKIGSEVFVAAGAQLIGELTIDSHCSIWFNTTIRADCNYIKIGHSTNIQDQTMIHVSHLTNPTIIGDEVTIGHSAVIHGCTIQNRCLIGMGAIIMDGVEVGEMSLVAAGSLLPPGKEYPAKHLIKGSPAKAVRPLSTEELKSLKESFKSYLGYKADYVPSNS